MFNHVGVRQTSRSPGSSRRKEALTNPGFHWSLLTPAATLVTAFLLSRTPVAGADKTPDQIAARLGENALTNSLAMDILTDLTTDIGPRLAGSEAEKRA